MSQYHRSQACGSRLARPDRPAQSRGAGGTDRRCSSFECTSQSIADAEGRTARRNAFFGEGVGMAKQELLVEVKKLISIGKEKGFLTYDELNSTLPAEVVSSEQFGSIMTMFGEMDIEIVDAPEGERIRKARDTEDSGEDAEDVEDEAGAGRGEENEKEE